MRQVCINKGTGALVFDITPVCAYSVLRENFLDEKESFGMLYYAEVETFEQELHSEIEKIIVTEKLINN